jgi:hypothetical protein
MKTDLKRTNLKDIFDNSLNKSDCQQQQIKNIGTQDLLSVCQNYTHLVATNPDSPWHRSANPLIHFQTKKLSRLQRQIIDFLHRYYFSQSVPCYLKIGNLASKFGVSRWSVQRAIASLEKRKAIISFQWFSDRNRQIRTMIIPNWEKLQNKLKNQELTNETVLSPQKGGHDQKEKENQELINETVASIKETVASRCHSLSRKLPKSLKAKGVYKYPTIFSLYLFLYVSKGMFFECSPKGECTTADAPVHIIEDGCFNSKPLMEKEPCLMKKKPKRYILKIKPSCLEEKALESKTSTVANESPCLKIKTKSVDNKPVAQNNNALFNEHGFPVVDMPEKLKKIFNEAQENNVDIFTLGFRRVDSLIKFVSHNTNDFDFDYLFRRSYLRNRNRYVAARTRKLLSMYLETFIAKKSLNFGVTERLIAYWNENRNPERMPKFQKAKRNYIELVIAVTSLLIRHSEADLFRVIDRIKLYSNTRDFSWIHKIKMLHIFINPNDTPQVNRLFSQCDEMELRNQIFNYNAKYPKAVDVTREFFIDTFYYKDRQTGQQRFSQFRNMFAQFTDSLIGQITGTNKDMCGLKLFRMTGENGTSALPVLFEYMQWFAAYYPLKIQNVCNLEMFGTFAAQEIRGKRGYANFWKSQAKNC